MMGDVLLYPGHLVFKLVILFRFSTWTMIRFCELLFQWMFNFQSFWNVILVFIYLVLPLVYDSAADMAEDVSQAGMNV